MLNNTVTSVQEVPEETVVRVPVDLLVLDGRNPRLTANEHGLSMEAIIAHLYRADDLSELLQSIASNGYMDIEPFIVMEEANKLTVLEGNRRLAAVLLFRDTELKRRIHGESSIKIPVPQISDDHRNTLDQISVYRVAVREDADAFIGFKHINGAARWSSYAKARFAARWHKNSQRSLTDIANQIGDSHTTIKRMVHAIHVLEQAQQESIFDVDDRSNPRFSFSHLYTALSRPDYRKFLGLETQWANYEPTPNPVPQEKQSCLGEVLKWIYGSKQDDLDPVVRSQNPDIKRLGEVLENIESLTVLRVSSSLDEAHRSIQPAEVKFTESLIHARSKLREVSNNLRGFDGHNPALVDIANDISEMAQAIHGHMKKKLQSTEGS